MKNLKTLVATLLVVTIMCVFSVTSFAFDLSKGYYTYEVKVENAEGTALAKANPGDEVYLAVYLYETANVEADVVVGANKNATLTYGIIIPDGFSADEATYEGSEGADFNTTAGTTTITDAEDFMVIINEMDITGGITIAAGTPIAKHKFVVSETLTEYSFDFYEDMISFADGTTGIAKTPVLTSGAVAVEEKAPAGPAAPTYGTPVHDYSDVTVGDVIYQNVYVGTYTATPDTGATIAKVGVKAGETVVGEKDITVDGDATVSFKIALLGVEDGIDVGLTAFAEYAE